MHYVSYRCIFKRSWLGALAFYDGLPYTTSVEDIIDAFVVTSKDELDSSFFFFLRQFKYLIYKELQQGYFIIQQAANAKHNSKFIGMDFI